MHRIVLVFLIILVSGCVFLSGQWDVNGTKIAAGANVGFSESVVELQEGSFCVAWSDTRSGIRLIRMQRFDTNGQPMWTEEGVNIGDSQSNKDLPVIAITSDSRIAVAWVDITMSQYSTIGCALVDLSGSVLWETRSAERPNFSVPTLKIVPDNQGGFYYFWKSADDMTDNVYCRRYASTGEEQWPIAAAFPTNGWLERPGIAIPDGEGGVYYAFDNYSNGSIHIDLLHIFPDADFTTQTLITNDGNVQLHGFESRNEHLYILWGGTAGEETIIRLAKLNQALDPVWDNPVVVYHGGLTVNWAAMISTPADECYVAFWNEDNGNQREIVLISGDGDLMWDEPCIYTNEWNCELGIKMSPTESGLIAAWMTVTNDGMSMVLQYISHEGIPAWPGGRTLEIIDEPTSAPVVIGSAGEKTLVWLGRTTEDSHISACRVDAQGNDLWEPANLGLVRDYSIYTGSVVAATGNNRVAVVYANDYIGDLCYYLQIIDGNGPTLPEGGQRIARTVNANPCSWPVVAFNSQNQPVVAWHNDEQGVSCVCLQCFDDEGLPLWGDDPLVLSEPGQDMLEPMAISCKDDRMLIAWSQYSDTGFEVHLQSVRNGQALWGPGGITVSTAINGLADLELREDYLIIRDRTNYELVVFRFDENGNPCQGWPFGGHHIPCPISFYAIEASPSGLLIIYPQNDVDLSRTLGQLISPEGQLLWADCGYPLSQWSEYYFIPEGLIWQESTQSFYLASTSNGISSLQRLLTDGSRPWGPEGVVLSTPLDYLYNVRIASMTYNGQPGCYLALCRSYTADSSIVEQRFFDETGTQRLSSDLFTVCNAPYYRSLISTHGYNQTSAILLWADGRALTQAWEGVCSEYALYGSRFGEPVAASDETVTPYGLHLHQNHPNPFNPSTSISFDLPGSGKVCLSIYNILGQKVATLVDRPLEAGRHTIAWHGIDDNGRKAPSGLYFYRIETKQASLVRKMILLK